MKRRFALVCLLASLGLMTLAPLTAHANSADQGFASRLSPIFKLLVAAGGKVEEGGSALSTRKFALANHRFVAALAVYQNGSSELDALPATADMAHAKQLLQKSFSQYIRGVTIYISGTAHRDANEVLRGVSVYNKGTTYLNRAGTEMKRILHP